MADALNSDESVESLWESGQHQQAIALQAVRSLLLERGRAHLDQDLPKLHGMSAVLICITVRLLRCRYITRCQRDGSVVFDILRNGRGSLPYRLRRTTPVSVHTPVYV